MNNKDLLYSAGNHIQNLIISYNGKESEKECVCVCVCVCVCMCLILLRIMKMVINPIEQIRKLTGLQRLRLIQVTTSSQVHLREYLVGHVCVWACVY